MKTLKAISSFLLLAALAGCSASGVIYSLAADERGAADIIADDVIIARLEKALIDDGIRQALDLSVFCYKGHVYLVGECDHEAQKEKAVKAARAMAGVKSVETYILPKKKHDSCGMADNLAIQGEMEARMVANPGIWSSSIEAKIVQCHIVLLGIAESQEELDQAVAEARSVKGSRGVKSYLKSSD